MEYLLNWERHALQSEKADPTVSHPMNWEFFYKLERRQTTSRFYNEAFRFSRERHQIFLDLVLPLSSDLGVMVNTFCLSLAVFDSILSKFTIPKKSLLKVGISCFLIAIKIREAKRVYKKAFRLIRYIENLDKKNLAKVERSILLNLNFDMNLVLPIDFLHFFVDRPEILESEGMGILEKQKRKLILVKTVGILNTSVLLHYHTNKFTSLVVAICILMIAREKAGFPVAWPAHLRKMTGYDKDLVWPCYSELQTLYHRFCFSVKAFELSGFKSVKTNRRMGQDNLKRRPKSLLKLSL